VPFFSPQVKISVRLPSSSAPPLSSSSASPVLVCLADFPCVCRLKFQIELVFFLPCLFDGQEFCDEHFSPSFSLSPALGFVYCPRAFFDTRPPFLSAAHISLIKLKDWPFPASLSHQCLTWSWIRQSSLMPFHTPFPHIEFRILVRPSPDLIRIPSLTFYYGLRRPSPVFFSSPRTLLTPALPKDMCHFALNTKGYPVN